MKDVKTREGIEQAMIKGQCSKQHEYMSEIGELQRQEQLLQWILN